ncbi:5' nucleotidase, NT5C type [Paenibacillus sp. 2TAB19]|uniref:5' nucleotidase, NT5C type n=1 Tax=Paenibacillus sp. 2TAB19 TaxID=3233003 RepID=UPI003F977360
MHIGIDLDNTVLDATSSHLHYYNQASGLSLTAEDVNDFYLYRMYGWDEAKRDAVYYQYGHDIHWNSSPLPMAAEILRELFQSHRISVITARPLHFMDVTARWLEHYDIPYHKLTLTEDKLQHCIDTHVDVLIDDGPHYVTQFAEAGRPVILYNQPYNLSVAHDSVYRAADWAEVKRLIAIVKTNIESREEQLGYGR